MKKRKKPNLSQGKGIFWSAFLGLMVVFLPLILFFQPGFAVNLATSIAISSIWALALGTIMTYWFSSTLHNRIKELKPVLTKGLPKEYKNRKGPPTRLPWIPFWLGIFERILFTLLVGLNVEGAGTFIIAWIGAKLASGWGTWSGGEAYGRAIFFAGFLGSALSLLYGVSAGLILQKGIAIIH